MQEVIDAHNGTTVDDRNILTLNLPTPNTLVFEPVMPNTTLCIFRENRQVSIVHPQNSKRRVKAKQIMRLGIFNKTYKAVTKSYKHKRGKWRKRRTHISAGVKGYHHDPSIGCPSEVWVDERTTIKNRRRREEPVRISRSFIIPNDIGANDRELYTRHHQNGVWHILYFEL